MVVTMTTPRDLSTTLTALLRQYPLVTVTEPRQSGLRHGLGDGADAMTDQMNEAGEP